MPYLSAFTPCGMLRFSSADSAAKKAYSTLASLQGGAFSLVQGTDAEAKTYATAMLLGRGAQVLERAKNQRDPLQAFELLPVLEDNFEGVPLLSQTLDQRRQAQSARMKRPAGGRRTDIEQALIAAIGSDFIAYRPTTTTEAATYPFDPSTKGLFTRTGIPPRRFRITSPVAYLETSLTISYVPILGAAALVNGDQLVMDAGNAAQREVVTVSGVTATTFTATFTVSHDVGSICTTGPFPAWSSTKRHSLVIVTSAAAMSPVTRNTIAQVMKKYARGVSTWSVVRVSAPGARTTNTFQVGVSLLGVDTIGSVAF